MAPDENIPKPKFRGIPDVCALFIIVPAAIALLTKVPSNYFSVALVYVLGLFGVFGISASYHTPTWSEKTFKVWRRMDHSMIYVFIACSYTPAVYCTLPLATAKWLLIYIWVFALIGLLKTLFWHHAPRALSVVIYIGMGWSILPFLGTVYDAVGLTTVLLFGAGGVLYSLGGIVYGKRWPNPSPQIFGYHETMHLFIIAGAATQFVAEWRTMLGA